MSNEMIERVANCIDPSVYAIGCGCGGCIRYKIIAKEAARIKAKKIIATMREPTEEMKGAGNKASVQVKATYQAMIDAALKED